MTVLQTKFILETLATLADTVLHSSTIGIISSYIFSCRDRVELSPFRLLFHASKPSSDFWRFGLSRSSPWASAQVVSLVFNEWSHEKGVILDVGWSSITCGTHPPTFGTSVHLEIEEKQRFGNRGKRRAVSVFKGRVLQIADYTFDIGFPVWPD